MRVWMRSALFSFMAAWTIAAFELSAQETEGSPHSSTAQEPEYEYIIKYGRALAQLKKMRQEVSDLKGHSLSIALEENTGRPGIFDPNVVLTELIYDGHDLLGSEIAENIQANLHGFWKARIGRIYCDVAGPPNGCALTIQILAFQAHEPWGEERGRQCYITIVSKDNIMSECRLWGEEYALPARADYGTARPALRHIRFEAYDIAGRSFILAFEEQKGPERYFEPILTPTAMILDGKDLKGTFADGVIQNTLLDVGNILIKRIYCASIRDDPCEIFINMEGDLKTPLPGEIINRRCTVRLTTETDAKGRCRAGYPPIYVPDDE